MDFSSTKAALAWMTAAQQDEAQAELDAMAKQEEADAEREAEFEREYAAGGHNCFTAGDKAKRFLLAGNARLTLVSQKTGTRFTFRVRAVGNVHFVSVLTGPNNEADYAFLGTIFNPATRASYAHGRKSKISPTAPSAKAFGWAIKYLLRGELPPACEVHHEGRCGKCGRPLTVPESIETGLGPTCADK